MIYPHYLLVDGYNIIHAWEYLREIAAHSLDDARSHLVNRLSNYQGYKGIGVIVVFDAYKVKGGTENFMWEGSLGVVYTREAETADCYIERAAADLSRRRYTVSVATSDLLEQIIILSKGARRLSAEELLRDVKAAELLIKQNTDNLKPVKNNQLADNLDPRTAAILEKMRRG
jgi:predicted RNA-binding protein with PIN domain